MNGNPFVLQKHESGVEETFIRAVQSMPPVLPVGMDNLPVLRRVFEDAAFDDPYAQSPAYYGLTGRRGLWICAHDRTAFLFCLHPNVRDQVLIFPLLGCKNPAVLDTFINAVAPLPGIDLRLARVPAADASVPRKTGEYIFRPQMEDILDWACPVHVVAIDSLMRRQGKNYAVVRQTMNKFSDTDLSSRPVNFCRDESALGRLAAGWEKSRTGYFRSYDIPSDYYSRLFDLARADGHNIHGLMMLDGEKPVGFSVWEAGAGGMANLFASAVADDNRTNLSTWLVVRSCEAACKQGMTHMCLGGSETAGMDRFKRKFVPHRSIALSTMVMSR